MLVEIWSDVVCPWCYIGKRRFETALREFEHASDVEVVWRSFELDRRAPFQRGGSMAEHLAAKYGMSVEDARARLESLDDLAAAEGLSYRLAETRGGNTFAAHRLIHLANEHGLGGDVKEGLLRAYFEQLRSASDPDMLIEVGVAAGLDRTEVESVVEGDRYAAEVRADEALAAELGCTGVPFFVIDRSFAIPGAQDADTMLAVLRRAWAKSHPDPEPLVTVPGEATGAPGCEGDSCSM
jgi:predicted DsbA family dithiol-disulfide isomerase